MKNAKDILKHGQYIPKNPIKYVGKYPIISRSSWELKFMEWLDSNPKIVAWSSESISISYFDPVKQKMRKYYPDFFLRTNNDEDFLVEIKPLKETRPPSNSGNKKSSTRLYEQKTWATNQAKWNAAKTWCDKMGAKFKIYTEKSLFGKGK